MKDMNQVLLLGRMGVNPELKLGKSGMSYCRFSVATHRKTKKPGDDSKPAAGVTDWHSVISFGKTAEATAQYLQKGALVLVRGDLRYRRVDQAEKGVRVYAEIAANEVLFIDRSRKAPTDPGSELTFESNVELTSAERIGEVSGVPELAWHDLEIEAQAQK